MIKKVICLVGPIASGKNTVSQHLSEKGYIPYSFSSLIKDEIKSRGQEVTRFTLNSVSNELRQRDPAVWAKRMADSIESKNDELLIVDGARNPIELQVMKDRYNAFIIGLTADQEKRYEMLKRRNLQNEQITFEQFKELDDRELEQEGQFAQQVSKCLEMADVLIENNGTIEELNEKVDQAISTFYSS